jgi:flagellar hook-associated protein 3 FlgL
MMHGDMQYYMRRQERDMASLENRMSRQTRIGMLRDDPIAASHAVRFQSYITRLERFEENAQKTVDAYRVSEAYERQAMDILQRLRELAVQGANGVFTKEDMGYMAAEVDELLSELAAIGNARASDGTYLFSGTETQTEPFRVVKQYSEAAGREVAVGVQYLGNIQGRAVEMGEGNHVEATQAGNAVFWAERQELIASRNVADYRVLEDSVIRIDGFDIELKTGDNALAIIAKINESPAGVKASLDPVLNSITLTGATPHQLWLEEGTGGTVWQDLGVLRDGTSPAPDNYALGVRVAGGSMFDAAIALRDGLMRGDIHETGGKVLNGIDQAVGNLSLRLAELGARTERLESALGRLNREIPDVTKQLAYDADIDMAKAITDFRMLEYARQASLGLAGKILPQTLMDFLR